MRKVCLEKASEVLDILKDKEHELIKEVLEFVRESFSDTSRWVKNAAFTNFGEIVYKIYLKTTNSEYAETLKLLIN